MMILGTTDKFVAEDAVSEMTGVKLRTLRAWRRQGRGPTFSRIEGQLVRYSVRHRGVARCPANRDKRSEAGPRDLYIRDGDSVPGFLTTDAAYESTMPRN